MITGLKAGVNEKLHLGSGGERLSAVEKD